MMNGLLINDYNLSMVQANYRFYLEIGANAPAGWKKLVD